MAPPPAYAGELSQGTYHLLTGIVPVVQALRTPPLQRTHRAYNPEPDLTSRIPSEPALSKPSTA